MSVKLVYEAPEAEALTFSQEGNFCATGDPVQVETEFFGEEEEW